MSITEQEARKTMEAIQTYCKSHPDFVTRLVEAEDIGTFKTVLYGAGFEIEDAGVEAFYNSIRKAAVNDSLSEEELENVSGGILILTGYALALATWALVSVAAAVFVYGFYKGLHS